MSRLFFLLFLTSLTVPSSLCLAAEVVVHPCVDEPWLTRSFARLLFTMRVLRWRGGGKVQVFVLPDRHPLHQKFAKELLNLYPRQLRRVWERNRFSGAGAVPIEVTSVDEMLARVASTPGAIGYLPDGRGRDKVRVIPAICDRNKICLP